MNKTLDPKRIALALIVLVVLWLFRSELGLETDLKESQSKGSGTQQEGSSQGSSSPRASAGTAEVLSAYRKMQSGLMIEAQGIVERLLRDDLEGSRHQVFILQLDGSKHTVKVSHNIDLAERIPLEVGDGIVLRGQYEFNELGGVLHWTHRDPSGRRAGGWIEHRSKRYQ
jgi:hypothetical protein